ncbi:MAG TPA: high frequency lysogenization protein HflD [Gammaproteobacteria bacterium]
MKYSLEDQVTALAGILQAAYLVDQVARRGMADHDAIEASVGSILKVDAGSVREVFGGLAGVELGLKQIDQQIGRQRDMNQTRYVINLLQLEARLRRRPDLGEQLSAGIAAAQRLVEQLPAVHPDVVQRLADTYQETLSQLRPRILVSGDTHLLQQAENAARIRALLLAGIRAAVLWRQCGGGRIKLLFQSGRVVRCTRQLLQQLYSGGR